MSNVKHALAVELRNEFGNNASRRMRRASRIPAVVYCKGEPARALSVDADEWKVISGHGVNMVTLINGDKQIPALVREVQYNHLKNYVEHIDFQEVDLSKEIHADVPVHTIGIAIGSGHGGVLEQEIHQLPVICRPDLLPEVIKVDISNVDVDQAITAADLQLPEGVRTSLAPETIILSVARPKEEAEPEAAAAEGDAAKEPEAINEKKTEARAAEKEAKEKEAKK